jgi:transcription initiation factor TFIID subunit TAF12
MTFTPAQQKKHRAAFIEECMQKAWSAACHAAWISESVDKLLADHKRLQEEDNGYDADIKELASRVDAHTVENRNKRKELQERRNVLAKQLAFLAQAAQQGVKSMEQTQVSIETHLALAKHAETWEWKEVSTGEKTQRPQP